MKKNYKAHPWHGISPGDDCPNEITAFIEIVPSDTIKYEIEKKSGYLKIDRPQKYSNIVPALYGFIPQTYCDEKVADLARSIGAQNVESGDDDPLDILVLTSHNVSHANILLHAIPIGGFCMIDKGEADDKIVAVLVDDQVYGKITDISELPTAVVHRLKHYFLTYKSHPDENSGKNLVSIDKTYGAEHAKKVILTSMEDYKDAEERGDFKS
ncbi:MAG: inorganic pyrophosphatase [Flavobacteriales bacterium]|nr:inorganic pyrophosphatase [Flavobacteriales bacterium]